MNCMCPTQPLNLWLSFSSAPSHHGNYFLSVRISDDFHLPPPLWGQGFIFSIPLLLYLNTIYMCRIYQDACSKLTPMSVYFRQPAFSGHQKNFYKFINKKKKFPRSLVDPKLDRWKWRPPPFCKCFPTRSAWITDTPSCLESLCERTLNSKEPPSMAGIISQWLSF